MHQNHDTIAHGKYRISPMTRLLDGGWYTCSVSIRSGTGRASTDRVVRLTRLFQSSIAAADYALAEGLRWIGAVRGAPLAA
jgi:hypothetical protein